MISLQQFALHFNFIMRSGACLNWTGMIVTNRTEINGLDYNIHILHLISMGAIHLYHFLTR